MNEKRSAGQVLQQLGAPLVQALPGVLQNLAAGAAGFLLAQAPVLGLYYPFGAGWTAAVPMPQLGSAVIGGVAGALVRGFEGAAAVCAMLIIGGIRWMLSEWKRLSAHPAFGPGCAAATVLVTQMLVHGSVRPDTTIFMMICESLLSAGLAWFLARGTELLQGSGTARGDAAACAGGILLAGGLLAALAGITWQGVSPGRMLTMTAVLCCGFCRGMAGGCLSGTVLGAMLALSAGEGELYPLSYGLAGLLAGCFAPVGRLAAAAAMSVSVMLPALIVPEAPDGALIEAVAAAVIFCCIPGRRLEQAEHLIFASDPEASPRYVRRSVVMRLDFAAKAIAHVSQSVEEVSRQLLRQCAPTVSGVYDRAVEETCAGCGMRMMCWQTHYEENTDGMNAMTPVLLERGRVGRGDLPPGLRAMCRRPDRLAQTVTAYYEDYVSHAAAEQRVTELRAVVSAQFRGLSDMLTEMADSFRQQTVCDEKISRTVRAYLESIGGAPMGVVCSVDEHNRMRLEFCARWRGPVQPESLRQPLEQICGRRFGPAGCTHSGGVARMVFSERAVYQAETGQAQHICRGAQLCGDHYEFFHDGSGRAVMLLSDGMGSGGRAAVDSAMTCGILSRLVLSGLGYDCALRMINSALYVKSGDESLATLDVATVDLYTGEAVLRKAGAAVGFLRRGQEVEVIDLASLPAGILQEVKFARADKKLAAGDWVVLVSDGALGSGTGWIEECIRHAEGTPQELCDEILQTADRLRRDGHDDDVTAAALRLKAV